MTTNGSTTSPKLTDEAVALLPLEAGRAELLEEIMSTVAPDRTLTEHHGESPRNRRSSRWLVPVAAAAAVAGIAAATLWGQGLLPGQAEESSSFAQQLDLPDGQGIVLDAPGWSVDSLGSDGIRFRKGDADLELTSYPADSYESYVEDRRHIVTPAADGDPIEVLGVPAQMWAYSKQDHAAIREVEAGHWIELRGAGMSEAGYLTLLGQLRFTSEAEFTASLPEGFVSVEERPAAAQKILVDIEDVSGAGFPSGETPSFSGGDSQDRYQFGVEIAGAYACAWIESYEDAVTHDQGAAAAEAARVLGTSRGWPVLGELDEAGDYPEVVWDLSDEVVAGTVPDGYREGLGC